MLRRVWLSSEDEEGYYYGCANGALWPLCHIAYARPEFNDSDWAAYTRVNRRFSDTVLQEIAPGPAIVFVQDYHFALLPRFIKDARPDVIVCQFWHIPWPNPEAFQVCPWANRSCTGCSATICCRFTSSSCNNFLETVERTLESRVDYERFAVVRGGHPTMVRPHPIGIDPELWAGPTRPPIVGRVAADPTLAGHRQRASDLWGRSPRLHQRHSGSAARSSGSSIVTRNARARGSSFRSVRPAAIIGAISGDQREVDETRKVA